MILVFSTEWIGAQTTGLPFAPGEYARYGAYYNWHFIWMQNGVVEFRVDTMHYQQQKGLVFKSRWKNFPGVRFALYRARHLRNLQ